ncbi:transposon ty3-I gag-pol polyprotein [Tanacetum coccineum]
MVTDLEDSKTHTVGGVWSGEYMDHGFTKSMKELDGCYTMLKELRSVIVGGALIHKNREGSKHEGRRIRPTIGDFGGNCASNQSSFNNERIEEWEEEKKENRDHHKRIAHGNLYNGLYIIKQEQTTPSSTTLSITHNNMALWHSRLGHPSFSVLQQIKSISTSYNCNSHECNVCPLAKQQALPFPHSNSNATALFDLIHIDLWGPYKHPTINKCKYFLTIVDDYSRATWTYLLPSKQHTASHIKIFHAFVLNHFKTTLKTIRSDNGSEFLN